MQERILNGLCFSNLWISLAALANFCAYTQMFGENPLATNALMVFLATFFLYNAQRLWFLPKTDLDNERLTWIFKRQRALKMISILALLIMVSLLFWLSRYQIVVGGILALLSIAYSYVPLSKPLRFFGPLKTLLVALVWLLVVFVFQEPQAINEILVVHALRFFVLVYVLTLLFEYRDRQIDDSATLARVLAPKVFKQLLYFLVGLVIILDLYLSHHVLAIADLVLTSIAIYKNFKVAKALFYSFYVDGILIVNAALVGLEKIL